MEIEKELAEAVRDVQEHVAYLQELGVETLDAGVPEFKVAVQNVDAKTIPAPVERFVPEIKLEVKQLAEKKRVGTRLTALPSLPRRMSVPNAAAPIDSMPPAPAPTPNDPAADALFGDTSGLPDSVETIDDIRADIGNCTRCPLHSGRTQIVHTVGNMNANLMIVGEAPGREEDEKGEPFVGRAGQLLNKIIEAIGMKRDEICIGNINRCRPPANRQPTLPEAHTCKPFLLREIAVIRPKVIVVLGNTALHNLLDTKIGITRMRGQFHDYFGVKVMPTFHPAYLLRDPSKKREVWDDMKKVRDYLTSLGL